MTDNNESGLTPEEEAACHRLAKLNGEHELALARIIADFISDVCVGENAVRYSRLHVDFDPDFGEGMFHVRVSLMPHDIVWRMKLFGVTDEELQEILRASADRHEVLQAVIERAKQRQMLLDGSPQGVC